MARKGKTSCELTLNKLWVRLPPLISDDDVEKMIQQRIISEKEVSEIKNNEEFEGQHDKIVDHIIFEIHNKGSGAVHILLEILLSSDNIGLLTLVDSELDRNDTKCSCETFLESETTENYAQDVDHGAVSSSATVNMPRELGSNRAAFEVEVKTDMEGMKKKIDFLMQQHEDGKKDKEKLQGVVDELQQKVKDLTTRLEESAREHEMLKEENGKFKHDLSVQCEKNNELEENLQKKAEEYNSLMERYKTLKGAHEERYNRLVQLNRDYQTLLKEHTDVKIEKVKDETLLLTQAEQTKKAEKKYLNDVSKLKSEIEKLNSNIDELKQERTEMDRKMKKIENKYEKLIRDKKELKGKVPQLRAHQSGFLYPNRR